jgi:hypothetical protein
MRLTSDVFIGTFQCLFFELANKFTGLLHICILLQVIYSARLIRKIIHCFCVEKLMVRTKIVKKLVMVE